MCENLQKTTELKDSCKDEDAQSSCLHTCANDPDFAVICAFLQKFSKDLGFDLPNLKILQEWLTNTDEVAPQLRDLHIKLLRKTRKTVHEKSWESALSKFCFTYSAQDAWEIERFGYKKSSLKVKLRILCELLESQFERNAKFRSKLLTFSADSLRSQPVGRDRLGHSYWFTQDDECNLRIYQEHLDEEIWQVVATNRDELVKLIARLRGNEVVLPSTDIGVVDEDTSSSNSCAVPVEKPPPPVEQDDSQEEELRVPNLRIKLNNNGRSDGASCGRVAQMDSFLQLEGEKVKKPSKVQAKKTEDDSFEDICEESEDGVNTDQKKAPTKESAKPSFASNPKLKQKDSEKKVKPIYISQSKIAASSSPTSSSNSKKRLLDDEDKKTPTTEEHNMPKKLRPTLLDSTRPKKPSRYEDDDEDESEEDDCEEDELDDGEEEGEEEDIDSAAAEEDEDEDKDIEEDDDDEDEVGAAIQDPPLIVRGEGLGKKCEGANMVVQHWKGDSFFVSITEETENLDEVSEAIEEEVIYITGVGSGVDCLVGNNKNEVEPSSHAQPKATFFFGEPGCLKLSPMKPTPKDETNRKDEPNESEQSMEELPESEETNDKNLTEKAPQCDKDIEQNIPLTQEEDAGEKNDKVNESEAPEKIDSIEESEKEAVNTEILKNEVNLKSNGNNTQFVGTTKEDTIREDTIREDTTKENLKEGAINEDAIKEDTIKEGTINENTVKEEPKVENLSPVETKLQKYEVDCKIESSQSNLSLLKVDIKEQVNEKETGETGALVEEIEQIEKKKEQEIVVIDTSDNNQVSIEPGEQQKIETDPDAFTELVFKPEEPCKLLPKLVTESISSIFKKLPEIVKEKEPPFEVSDTPQEKPSEIGKVVVKPTVNIAVVRPTASVSSLPNRKRRLSELQVPQSTRSGTSDSEIDLHAENLDDAPLIDELDEVDVGGKRFKMRPKLTNFEFRKKVEAQKYAAGETSSSGEEDSHACRKVISPKRQIDKEVKSPAATQDVTEKPRDEKIEEPEIIHEIDENETYFRNENPATALVASTTAKLKPTLTEIIEKKLKKIQDKPPLLFTEASGSSKTATPIFPPLKKLPITKPLKKNLLTQIRQEESDEEAIPRKRTNSETVMAGIITSQSELVSVIAKVESVAAFCNISERLIPDPKTSERKTLERKTPERKIHDRNPEQKTPERKIPERKIPESNTADRKTPEFIQHKEPESPTTSEFKPVELNIVERISSEDNTKERLCKDSYSPPSRSLEAKSLECETPESRVLHSIVSENIAPESEIQELIFEESKEPEIKAPERKIPERDVPECTTLEFTNPEVKHPESTTPELKYPEGTSAELTTPNRITSERTSSEVKHPERASPERTTLEHPSTERNTPERTSSELNNPGHTERITQERISSELKNTGHKTSERKTTERKTTERSTPELRNPGHKTSERKTAENNTSKCETPELENPIFCIIPDPEEENVLQNKTIEYKIPSEIVEINTSDLKSTAGNTPEPKSVEHTTQECKTLERNIPDLTSQVDNPRLETKLVENKTPVCRNVERSFSDILSRGNTVPECQTAQHKTWELKSLERHTSKALTSGPTPPEQRTQEGNAPEPNTTNPKIAERNAPENKPLGRKSFERNTTLQGNSLKRSNPDSKAVIGGNPGYNITERMPPERNTPELQNRPDRSTPELKNMPEPNTPELKNMPEPNTPELKNLPETNTPELKNIPVRTTTELKNIPERITMELKQIPEHDMEIQLPERTVVERKVPERKVPELKVLERKVLERNVSERRILERSTPDRQRKRRSSEEVKQREAPQPDGKAQGVSEKMKKNNEEVADIIIVEEKHEPKNIQQECEQVIIKEEEELKKEMTPPLVQTFAPATASASEPASVSPPSPQPPVGRRSGRRGGAAVVYTELPQLKRTRATVKVTPKKEEVKVEKVDDESKDEDLSLAEIKGKEVKGKEKKTVANAKKEKQTKKPEKQTKKKETPEKKDIDTEAEAELKEVVPKEEQSAESASNSTVASTPTTTGAARGRGSRKKREVDCTNIIETTESETPVRQSRRIAQQKIREEAERRKLEEIALRTMKQELKKKKKAEKQADPTVVEPSEPSSSEEESELETKKKVKKKCPGKDGWSSGSEEQEEPEEEDEEPPHYYTDPGSPLFKSDHEFSPESDLEDESQVVPTKRARTARKEDAEEGEDGDEEACQKCGKSDHPEWILLCDICDKGYHCSCLSPVLFYIPEGDWYCPPCQQEQLIAALERQLKEFDELVELKRLEEVEAERRLAEEAVRVEQERLEKEKKRKERKKQKHNGKRRGDEDSDEDDSACSDSNDDEDGQSDKDRDSEDEDKSEKIASNKKSKKYDSRDKSDKRRRGGDGGRSRRRATRAARRRRQRHRRNDSESGSNSATVSESVSESGSKRGGSSSSEATDSDDEPIYKLRKRRQINVSYRLNEFDDLINSALKKEMDEVAGAGNLGRGKDITTIIEADKEEKARQKQREESKDEADELDEEEKENSDEVDEKADDKIEESETPIATNENLNDKVGVESDDDDEPLKRKAKPKIALKKKPRKLTKLDISSEEDDAADEDFKTSSFDDDEEDEDTSISMSSDSDSSLDIYRRRRGGKKKQRKAARRAARERRKDRKFVVEETDDDEVLLPKTKKKRKEDSDYTESETGDDDNSDLTENLDSADLCDDTTSDESDGAWCPSKRKKQRKSNAPVARKSPKLKKPQPKKVKRVEYSDDDISESEEEEDDEDDMTGGKGSGKQPRSQPLKTTSTGKGGSKTGKGKGKPTAAKKKKKKSDEEEDSFSDSEDSTRRTRGRRYAYLEDFDDDSSDGGIKPGVKRPDTPPEEREKFIQRQEEIKRMLAEKNAEGAKLAATPRLTPIKAAGDREKRSPLKPGDSLSTVPLSVIRQAKVLDIDYLQRKGETVGDLENVEDSEFDDADLPDDLPEDMDEDAIARMVEEEEFGTTTIRELPAPDEVLRTTTKSKSKEIEKPLVNPSLAALSQMPGATHSGLQEPLRKRLPMPTMHPPLLRHQFPPHSGMPPSLMMQRHIGPPTHLLQNALSAPLGQPLGRSFPPHPAPRMPGIPGQHAMPRAHLMPTRQPLPAAGAVPTGETAVETETKPRGRRKKITPLRDPLQKQQAAAAATAASHATTSTTKPEPVTVASNTGGVIKSAAALAPTLTVAQPPQRFEATNARSEGQLSVITRMPHLPPHTTAPRSIGPPAAIYCGADVSRFYSPPHQGAPGARQSAPAQRHRGPPHMTGMPPHTSIRPTYGPPPPLRGGGVPTNHTQPPVSVATGTRPPYTTTTQGDHHGPGLGAPYATSSSTRHAPPHLNPYRPPIYGNPNYAPRVAPPGAIPANLRPGAGPHGAEYGAGGRPYAPYGYYPPPPPLTTPHPQAGPPPTHSTVAPSSVIVAAPSAASAAASAATQPSPGNNHSSSTIIRRVMKSPSPTAAVNNKQSIIISAAEPRKKLMTLETYPAAKSPLAIGGESSGSRSSPNMQPEGTEDSSSTPATSIIAVGAAGGSGEGQTSEFSGLVSYFSSQHDDYNT